ncbi:unnamed protein product, partial [Durusdinium trenchii]
MDAHDNREAAQQNSMTADYVERVHRGLISAGGHVEGPEVQVLEWQSLRYLETVNRWHDGLKLRKRWKKVETIQGERLSGATAIIILDDGHIVQVPTEYVEQAGLEAPSSPAPMVEPEPTPGDESMEADDAAMESDESAPEVVAAAWEPESIRIPDAQFENYNRAYNRADLRAREELLKMEANWFHGHRNGNRSLMSEMYDMRES